MIWLKIMVNNKTYRDTIKKFGVTSQLRLLQEECAELIVAVNKIFRKQSYHNFYEECADVEIMLEQVKVMFPKSIEKINEIKIQKLERLKGLLNE